MPCQSGALSSCFLPVQAPVRPWPWPCTWRRVSPVRLPRRLIWFARCSRGGRAGSGTTARPTPATTPTRSRKARTSCNVPAASIPAHTSGPPQTTTSICCPFRRHARPRTGALDRHGTGRRVPRPPPRRRGHAPHAPHPAPTSQPAQNSAARRIETLQPIQLDLWRAQLPALSAHYIFRAFRQVLAVRRRHGPARGRTRPARIQEHPRRRSGSEQRPFASWEEVEAIAAEIDPRYAAIPIVLAGTGLRPEELSRSNAETSTSTRASLSVERVYTQRVLKEPKKSSRQRRRVPLRSPRRRRAPQHFRRVSTLRSSSRLPAADYIDDEKFRYREWAPALRAAGIEHRRVYDTPAHVRLLGDRRRRATVLPCADHGDERRADRRHIRAPATRQRGLSARPPRGPGGPLTARNPCSDA